MHCNSVIILWQTRDGRARQRHGSGHMHSQDVGEVDEARVVRVAQGRQEVQVHGLVACGQLRQLRQLLRHSACLGGHVVQAQCTCMCVAVCRPASVGGRAVPPSLAAQRRIPPGQAHSSTLRHMPHSDGLASCPSHSGQPGLASSPI